MKMTKKLRNLLVLVLAISMLAASTAHATQGTTPNASEITYSAFTVSFVSAQKQGTQLTGRFNLIFDDKADIADYLITCMNFVTPHKKTTAQMHVLRDDGSKLVDFDGVDLGGIQFDMLADDEKQQADGKWYVPVFFDIRGIADIGDRVLIAFSFIDGRTRETIPADKENALLIAF